ncbi:MAG: 50S ribosome-binding GTPase [Dermabacter sp.]|nr:50S ribosome-binding GTPase [Dermabacter sp.]
MSRRPPLETTSRALDALIADAAPVLDAEASARLQGLSARIDARSSRSARHTVVGLFGSTGSGKSSLLNALTGTDIARVAARRPTTSRALAAIVPGTGSDGEQILAGAHELLDWLDIGDRHVVSAEAGEPGTIYVDMPDVDSVDADNRALAERLARMVDVLAWVCDPEKYADAVVHTEFMRTYAEHDAVSIAIVNQMDRLAAAEQPRVLASLAELMEADGLRGVRVLGTSAATGEGIGEVREAVGGIARTKSAALKRLEADARTEAAVVAAAVGASERRGTYTIEGLAREVPEAATRQFVDALAEASQVEAIARAVQVSYRRRGRAATGWPPLRWIGTLAADPLARMRIGRGANTHRVADTSEEFVARSSLSVDAPGAVAHMSRGLDTYVDAVAGEASPPWPRRLRHVVEPERERLPDTVDYALTHTEIDAKRRAWWWTPLNIVQWLAVAMVAAGLLWLLALAGLGFFQIPLPAMPMLEGLWVPVPVPTAMIVAGLVIGVLVAIAAGFFNRVAAARQRARARRDLRASIRGEVDTGVAGLLRAECARATRITEALGQLAPPR